MEKMTDTLAERSLAQELIRANQQAEAAETERLREQTKHYEAELNVLKDQADRNMEAIAGLHDKLDKSSGQTHDTGVRIYRNVQAVILDEQKKQTEEITATLSSQFTALSDRITQLEKNAEEERRKQQEKEAQREAEKLKEAEENAGKENKGSTFTMLMLVALIAILALEVLNFMGISF